MEPSAPNREKAARLGGFFLLLNEFKPESMLQHLVLQAVNPLVRMFRNPPLFVSCSSYRTFLPFCKEHFPKRYIG